MKNEYMKNANAAHSVKESHSIDWENARIVDREQNCIEDEEDEGEPVHQEHG